MSAIRRHFASFVQTVCCTVTLGTYPLALLAQQYPAKGVRIVAPFPAGGGADLNVRRLADRLNKKWMQPVIIDNISGAGGGVAAVAVAKAKPDGYTLLFATHPILAINQFLYDKLPFDPEVDFVPVVQLSETPNILLTNPALAASTVAELIALAKARPRTLNFGSGGVGTSVHLAGEMFKAAAGIEIVHIPYKGSAPAISALIGNEIQLYFDTSTSAIGHIRGGRIRGLAIASMTRLPVLQDLPTFDESGLHGFVATLAYGILTPAAAMPIVISALNRDINSVLSDPDYRKQMVESGVNPIGGSPEHFRAFLASERKKWGELTKKLGIKPD